MNLSKVTQMLVYRLVNQPAFLKTYGEILAKDRTLGDKKLAELARILTTKYRNGLISTPETWDVITDATLTRIVTVMGSDADQTLDDAVLVTLYMRLQGLHALRDKTLAAITQGDVGDKSWETLVRAYDAVIRAGAPAGNNMHYGGEMALTDSPLLLYEEIRAATTASAQGMSLTSGLAFLDSVACAPVRRDVMLVLGHSGSGKSYLMDAMALANAVRGFKVVVITLEMTVVDRMSRIEGLLLGTVAHQNDTFMHSKHEFDGVGVVSAAAVELPRFGTWRNRRGDDATMCCWAKHSDGSSLALPVNEYIVGRDGCINQRTLTAAIRARSRLKECGGDVRVKAFPINVATLGDIEQYLDDCASDEFIPDMIIVDYPALLDLGESDSAGDSSFRLAALMSASRHLKRLAQKFNAAMVFVHQAKDTDTGGTREIHKVGELELARPPIGAFGAFGARNLINEAAIVLGLNQFKIGGIGVAVSVLKTRNTAAVSEVLVVQTGFPVRYAVGTYTAVHQVHQKQTAAKPKWDKV